jgi:hypothetical protein
MDNIQNQISFFEKEIENSDKLNAAISGANVGWHIAHCSLVMVGISNAITTSNPAEYTSKFNWKKSLVFFTNKIPRGKAKAPDRVKPREVATKESLLLQIDKAKQAIKQLDVLDKNAFFEHPFFGILNLKETKKFLEVHNHHHSKIIKDILK